MRRSPLVLASVLVDRQLVKDVPMHPLYQVPFLIACRKTVRNFDPAPSNFFWNAENWWLAESR